jgi:hypothetical protein
MRLPPVLVALVLLAPASALALGTALETPEAPALARAHALLNDGSWLGKSPQGWIDWADAALAPTPKAGPSVDLATAVAQVYDAVGVQPTDEQSAQLAHAVQGLNARTAAVLAPLVATVAQAYAEQKLVPAQLDFDGPSRGDPVLPQAAAAASVARADRILASIAAFQEGAATLPLEATVPGFRDPLGLVVLGGTADETFLPDGMLRDPVVLADLGGDDTDYTSSGGACVLTVMNAWANCNGLALAVRVDLGGNDRYLASGERIIAQGAGAFGGLGILVDDLGDDLYQVDLTSSAPSHILGYITATVQGGGEAGVGIIVDGLGSDRYQFNLTTNDTTRSADAFAQGQGFAGLGGLGAIVDAQGDDTYAAEVRCGAHQGDFCGLYTDATALYPGVALLVDSGGNDHYRGVLVAPQEDYYAQSFAGFGALTILLDKGGNDDYYASATTTEGGFGVSLNCAFGTAEYAGALAILIDAGGNDRYLDETYSVNRPYTMAEGYSLASASLFWDVEGNDVHSMVAVGPSALLAGRGTGHSTLEAGSVYLDTGGTDLYQDTPVSQRIGADGAIWGVDGTRTKGVGIDINVLGSGLIPGIPF